VRPCFFSFKLNLLTAQAGFAEALPLTGSSLKTSNGWLIGRRMASVTATFTGRWTSMLKAIEKRILLGVFCGILALGGLPSNAAAQATVEKDADTVTAIRNLEIGNLLYDVEFFNFPTPAIYGEPPEFDFDTTAEATTAVHAVDAILNADGGARLVGSGADAALPYFSVGYGHTVIEIDFDFTPGPFDIHIHRDIGVTFLYEGATDPPDAGSTNWVNTGATLRPSLEDGNYADFIVVGTTGSGNLPPRPRAGGPYVGAVGVEVSFDGSGSEDFDGSITSYAWDFGDMTTGTGKSPTHMYAMAGLYNVTLTVTDDSSVSNTDTTAALIGSASQPPVADVGGPYLGTMGAAVTFDGSSSSDPDGTIVAWDWDFGDSTMGTGVSPSKTYATAGRYDVTLTVTDNSSETASETTRASIGVGNQPPMAGGGVPVMGVVDMAVSFDGSDSSDPDGTIVTFDWAFGDGNFGTGVTPSHTYATPDIYIVLLTVTDDGGATDSTITAACIDASNQSPLPDANGPYTGTVGMDVVFDGTGSSDKDGTILAHAWDFGDGSTGAGAMPSYTYAAAGNYCVSLLVIDDDGATALGYTTVSIDSANQSPVPDANGPYAGLVDVPVTFDGTGSSDPDGHLVSLVWDFGDESRSGSGEQPSHTYTAEGTYDVTLTATDDQGAVAQMVTQSVIGVGNAPPAAEAGGPYVGTVGVAISFDGTGSIDRDGSIATYDWAFGDGMTGTGATPSHIYSDGGDYNVSLTVTDDAGVPASDRAMASIGAASQPPVADANGPYAGSVDAAVSFDGSDSSDPDGSIATYDWDFGDNTAGTGANPTHAYTAEGTYPVTLTVTDDTGETHSNGTQASIGLGNLPPAADAVGPYLGLSGMEVLFDGSSSSDQDGTIANYAWAFGDSTTGTGAMPSHTYETAGQYNVTLTVTDDTDVVNTTGTAAVLFDDVDNDTIPNTDDKDNDNDGIKDKKDLDKDGDGWDAPLEMLAGTNDFIADSVPPSGIPGSTGPGVKSLKLVMNRAKPGKDTISLKGTVPVSPGLTSIFADVAFSFENPLAAGSDQEGAPPQLVRSYTLDAKGKFNDGFDSLSFSNARLVKKSGTPGAYVSDFTYKLKKQNLAAHFPQFLDATLKNVAVPLNFMVTLDGVTFSNQKELSYTATQGKKGTAKQPKPKKN
jgi:PKD repeat protein